MIVKDDKLNQRLVDTFTSNLNFLRQAAPAYYQQYKNYQPTGLKLALDSDGYLNLVNVAANNVPVYQGDPLTFCSRQLEHFLNNPKILAHKHVATPEMNPAHIHVPLINQLIADTEPFLRDAKPNNHQLMGTVVVAGCGLGYHIEQLLKARDIYNLIIFEPSSDIFYASLHVLDWRQLIQSFTQQGRTLKLLVGVSVDESMVVLQDHARQAGLFSFVNTFVYLHLGAPIYQDFIKRLSSNFHQLSAGTGFFDDEQVGFAHTIANINRQIKLFNADSQDKGLPPVFVLGNGPSLDKHIDFIKQHHHHAFIISCGTSLSSLMKTGIKPDFHVEMERNINIKDWLTVGTTPEYRRGITLLCLNTVAPGVMALFDDVCMAKKPNDIGESLIDQSIEGQGSHITFAPLPLCNPTVTNAGLSFALAMGFKQIYLLGIDLGMGKQGEHHSKLSIYHDLEEKTQTKGHSDFEDTRHNFDVPGNFGGSVSSNIYFDATRFNMEVLLHHYQKIGGDIHCYNPNDGAFIRGATPIRTEDILLSPSPSATASPIDKHALQAHIASRCFIQAAPRPIDSQDVKNLLQQFFSLKNQLFLNNSVNSFSEIYRQFDHLFKLAATRNGDPISRALLKGSLNEFFSIMCKATACQKDPQQLQAVYQLGRTAFMQFVERAFAMMAHDPLKLDDTYDQVKQKMEGDKKPPLRVAIIPARGGSKRIARKNIKSFHGQPIIKYSIQAAHNSGCFDRVIVSTDDDEIADVAKQLGAEVPFMRPDSLADDFTPTVDVLKHAIEWLEQQGETIAYACCIYATAPFIGVEAIRRGADLVAQPGVEYAFSATAYAFPIQRAFFLDAQNRVSMSQPEHFNTRSQDLPPAYHDAGQFYWGSASAFKQAKPFFADYAQAVLLPRYLVQDMDTEEDWLNAELMYALLHNKGLI